MKPHLHVACAIIEQEGTVLATQRSVSTTLPLKWEFPGGKIETGESPEECLHRELNEELGITVTITDALPNSTHSYPDFTVTLYPFACRWNGDKIILHEHNAMLWVKPERMSELDWAAADRPVIVSYLARPSLPVTLPSI